MRGFRAERRIGFHSEFGSPPRARWRRDRATTWWDSDKGSRDGHFLQQGGEPTKGFSWLIFVNGVSREESTGSVCPLSFSLVHPPTKQENKGCNDEIRAQDPNRRARKTDWKPRSFSVGR